mmetsp:Transcript_13382/g.15286  ORF Transcript_13382/g.15286 Transcript_13382/m.15286 type:complete len:94 (-) Transcript_13382:427-708(-)
MHDTAMKNLVVLCLVQDEVAVAWNAAVAAGYERHGAGFPEQPGGTVKSLSQLQSSQWGIDQFLAFAKVVENLYQDCNPFACQWNTDSSGLSLP